MKLAPSTTIFLLILGLFFIGMGGTFQWNVYKGHSDAFRKKHAYDEALKYYKAHNVHYTPHTIASWVRHRRNQAGYYVQNQDLINEPSQLNRNTLRETRYSIATLKYLNDLKPEDSITAGYVSLLYVPDLASADEAVPATATGPTSAFRFSGKYSVGVRPTMDAIITLSDLNALDLPVLDLKNLERYILAHQNKDGGFWDPSYPQFGRRSTLMSTSFALRALGRIHAYRNTRFPEEFQKKVTTYVANCLDKENGLYAPHPHEIATDSYDTFRAFISLWWLKENKKDKIAYVNHNMDVENCAHSLIRFFYLPDMGAFSRHAKPRSQKASIKATHLIVWFLSAMGQEQYLHPLDIARFVMQRQSSPGRYGSDIYSTYSATGIFHWLDISTQVYAPPVKPERYVPPYSFSFPVIFYVLGLVLLVLSYVIKKRESEKIALANITLEREVAERIKAEKELEKARRAAEEANEAKSAFLANMSHEIRTPMNAIIGLSHLALKTELSPKQHDYLKKIDGSAQSLLGVLNDILDFSKIEAGKMDIEHVKFHLEDVLDALSTVVSVRTEEKHLELLFSTSANVPQALVGDPLRLGQILTNLTNNAVKFTQKGEIVLSTRLLEQHNDEVTLEFSVRDTGIGITQKQIAHLFDSFSQADTSTTRNYGGTGLGLAISKKLVEMMHGKIHVHSEYGQGSTFYFTAKFGTHSLQRIQSSMLADTWSKLPVLVVDDNLTAREILKEVIESFGPCATLAKTGEEAIELIKKADADGTPYQLVLMDWIMPGIGGIEATARIKQERSLTHVPPIILATAYGREEARQEAESVGMDGFLLKPINYSTMFDAMVAVLSNNTEDCGCVQRKAVEEKYAHVLDQVRGAHVLVVDDNEINQQIARELLVGERLRVDTADNGRMAVDMVARNEYDAVLMDIQMPVLDGYQATQEIRDKGFATPIIAMTAHAMAGDREKCLNAGMNDHVTKPINPAALFSALTSWITPGQRDIPPADSTETTPTEKSYLPNELPGFSIETGLANVVGNEELYKKLLLKFLHGNEDAQSNLAAALELNDTNTAANLVHTMKGVGGNLGATILHQAAMHLETAITNNDVQHLATYRADFEQALEQVLQTLRALDKENQKQAAPPSAPAVLNLAAIHRLLKGLATQLQADVSEAMNTITELKPLLETTEAAEEYTKLVECVDSFDMDSAQIHLTNIAQKLELEL